MICARFLAGVFLFLPANAVMAADDPADNQAKINEAFRKMRDPNPYVRIRGTYLITDAPFDYRVYAKTIIPEMIRVLDDPEETVRRNALWILGLLGSELKDHFPKIAACLEDPSARVRENALIAVGYCGSDAKKAVPTIMKLLASDKDPVVRRFACFTLVSIGEKSEAIVLAFLNASRDTDKEVRQYSIQGIQRLATLTEDVSNALLERMKDENEFVRKEAIFAAFAMKMDQKALIPALKKAIVDTNSFAGREAASAVLKDIGEPALPILIECIEHKDAHVRYIAAWALGFLGSGASKATNKLTGILQADPEATVRARAAASIGAIGEPVNDIVPVLTKALKDNDKDVRIRAQEALDLIESRKKTLDPKK